MALGTEFTRVLAAAKSGAEWAWAAIYRDLAGTVRGYLVARGARDADDLTSETFLQIARDIRSFQGDEQGFRSWVFVIAHRRLIDSWRAADKRPIEIELPDPAADVVGGNAEDEALNRFASADVLAALARLTEDQRAVLALRVIAGLSVEQTAEVLGKRSGTVRVVQHRALSALYDLLEFA